MILPTKSRYAMHYVDERSVAYDLRVLGAPFAPFVPALPTAERRLRHERQQALARLDQAMPG